MCRRNCIPSYNAIQQDFINGYFSFKMEEAIHCSGAQKWFNFRRKEIQADRNTTSSGQIIRQTFSWYHHPNNRASNNKKSTWFCNRQVNHYKFITNNIFSHWYNFKGPTIRHRLCRYEQSFRCSTTWHIDHETEHDGTEQTVLRTIWSFLTDRKQYVKIDNITSRPIGVPSGVFQGSHCSPKFFIAYINDVESCIKYAIVIIFADDKASNSSELFWGRPKAPERPG